MSHLRRKIAALVGPVLVFAAILIPAAPARASTTAKAFPAAMAVRIRGAVARDLAAYGAKTPVPGVLLGIWRADGSSMVEGIGHARLSPPRPLALDDHIRIGSNTKTFVVTALLQFVDARKLSLDDPVSRFALPVHVKGGDKITVRELTCRHSSTWRYARTFRSI